MATPSANAAPGGPATTKSVTVFEQISYTVTESRVEIQGHTLVLGGPPATIYGPGLVNHTVSLIAVGTGFVVADATISQPVSFEITSASSTSITSSTSVLSSSQATTTAAPVSNPATTKDTQSDALSNSTSSTSSPASTTQVASNSTASTYPPSSHGVSQGATAGIAIGCAAVGALIAAALVFLIFRRRRDKRVSALEYSPTDKSPSTYNQAEAISPTPDAISGSSSSSSAFALAERDLPLPLEDAAVSGELSKLQTLIKNYAQSYYHTSPVASQNAHLNELGSNVPIPASRLAGMLADPRTRITAIRFCLMWIITSRIAVDSEPTKSLLPLEVISLLRLMPGAKEPNSPPSFPPWRALTHRLLSPSSHPLPTTTTSPSSPTLNAVALQLAGTTLDTIFQPYVDPTRDSYERMSKLEGILERGARFGWMLFGQMSELRVEWMGEREQGRLVLVERELGQGSKSGKLGRGGRVLWEGEQVRWDGVAELKGDDYVMES